MSWSRSLSLAPESTPDERLLSDALQGSERAFEELVRRHEDRVFAVALRVTRDRGDALDATQEAFLTLFRRGSSFEGRSAFTTWLYRITVNACHDVLRKKARAPEPVSEVSDRAETGAEIDVAVATRMEVAEALRNVPEGYREAMVMHDVAGIPYEEIAAALDLAVGTVKSRISRGRRRLAELLEHREPDGSSKGER